MNKLKAPMPQNVSPQELYDVMCGAASQDPARVQASAARLKEMLDLFGTFDALHEIASQKAVALPVRQQSIIQFKNGALGHWRSRKLMSDEQRANTRSRSLSFITEEDDLIADTNKIIVGKIARQDFPTNWPNLVPDLVGIINGDLDLRLNPQNVDPEPSLRLRRSLQLLNEVLKEFTSIKMPGGIRTAGQLVMSLHLPFYNHYSRLAGLISAINPATINSPRSDEDLRLAHLVLKCLVKMTTWLFSRIGSTTEPGLKQLEPWMLEFCKNAAIQLQTLSELRINLVLSLRSSQAPTSAAAARSIDQLTRHIRLLGKFFRRLQQLDVRRFVALPLCTDLIMYYWSKVVQATSGPPELVADSQDAVFPVRFLVQGMVLFRESLAQWAPERRDGSVNENVLSQTFVEDAVKLLVTQFIPLKPMDLEGWMEDPEEWVNLEDKENEQWEYELRPCGERVLMTLANQYRQYVTPLLQSTFNQVVAQPTNDLPSILQKEALYCAIGRCATRLKDSIPFDQWLEQSLLPECRETNPSYPIIKRRIAWVIGKWISDDCSPATNPRIWEALVHLLQDRGPGTDTVVRLTAAVSIRECVDTLKFSQEVFAPFLPATVTGLVALLAEADTLDSKRRMANSLHTVIERAGLQVAPLMQTIAAPIPQLWTEAGEDWLFKSSLLITLTKLIEAVGEPSSSLSGLVVPLVRECLTPGPAMQQLDQDALILWETALQNLPATPGQPSALFPLFPLAISFLAENLDLLGKAVGILESYYLLEATAILQTYAVDLFRAYVQAINHAMVTNIRDMLSSLGFAVQLAPSSLWGEAMHISGLFPTVLQSLIDDKAPVQQLTDEVHLFARIAATDRVVFCQLMEAAIASQASPLPNPQEATWEAVMDQWWNRFDNMSEPRHRKLTAMAMANLVATGQRVVMKRLPSEIFNLWLDVFGEIKEARNLNEDSPGSSLTLYWEQDLPPLSYFRDTAEGSPEHGRRKAVYEADPVRTCQLTAFVGAALRDAEAAVGGPQGIQPFLATVDPTVMAQIQTHIAEGR